MGGFSRRIGLLCTTVIGDINFDVRADFSPDVSSDFSGDVGADVSADVSILASKLLQFVRTKAILVVYVLLRVKTYRHPKWISSQRSLQHRKLFPDP